MTETESPGANSAAIEPTVVESVADDHSVDAAALATLVTVVGTDLTDAHSDLERETAYATVDQTRVYDAGESTWEDLLARNEVEDLAAPLRDAHREQAARLVDAPPADPLVVGVDTAEEPDAVPRQYGGQ